MNIHPSHLPGPHHHIHCHNHPHLHHHLQSLPDTADIQKLNLKNPITTLVDDNEFLNSLDEEIRKTEQSVKEVDIRFQKIRSSQSPIQRKGVNEPNSVNNQKA